MYLKDTYVMDAILNTKEQAQPAASTILKPLLRGWSHALAAVGAVALTVVFCWLSRKDTPRLLSLLTYGLSMIELYTVSATYHIGRWRPTTRRVLRAVDHANIFVLIAGTYTPLCANLLSGWVRVAILVAIWALALTGIGLAIINERLPRWVNASLYVGMGWVALLVLPALFAAMRWGVLLLVLGGALYTAGAVIYARKRPDPFPRIFGYHEVFHLLVIAGSAAFAVAIGAWTLPLAQV
jgi:hemolysin III